MTKFQKWALLFFCVAIALLVTAVCCKISYKRGYNKGYSALHPADTLVVTDTIRIDQPVIVEKWVEKDRPVYIAVHDTTRVNDTTYVVLPREIKQYSDSTYRAQVSGVQPNLDWIEVYQKTQTITNYVEKYKYPSLIVSPVASVEVLPMSVFAGAGIAADYRTGIFQFSVELGYGINGILGEIPSNLLDKEFKLAGSKAGIYGKLGAKINIIRK